MCGSANDGLTRLLEAPDLLRGNDGKVDGKDSWWKEARNEGKEARMEGWKDGKKIQGSEHTSGQIARKCELRVWKRVWPLGKLKSVT